MVTAIIAIYGAVLSTTSVGLGIWYFLYSGPRLQAQADVYPPADDEGYPAEDEWYIVLKVWNTGRAEVTVDISDILIHHDGQDTILIGSGSDYSGPEVPIRLKGSSGESWWIKQFDPQPIIGDSFRVAQLSVDLEVAGKRRVTVLVLDGQQRKKKRPFILKPILKVEQRREILPENSPGSNESC